MFVVCRLWIQLVCGPSVKSTYLGGKMAVEASVLALTVDRLTALMPTPLKVQPASVTPTRRRLAMPPTCVGPTWAVKTGSVARLSRGGFARAF